MSLPSATLQHGVVAALRRMAAPSQAEERCDLCNSRVAPAHRHLLEVATRKINCACDACAMRFQSVVGGRFKLIPRDGRILSNFQMTDTQWETLAVPINLTFFHRDTPAGKVIAMYPSPAGATESLLPAANWAELEAANPALVAMEADVEALLINRMDTTREYFIVPIDVCYELTGLIRMHWRGLFGGQDVWEKINAFFAALRERAIPAAADPVEAVHA